MQPDFLLEFLTFIGCIILRQGLFVQPLLHLYPPICF